MTTKEKHNKAIEITLSLSFKLIRTIYSTQFKNDLNKDWAKSKNSEKIKAIQIKCQNSMKKALNNLNPITMEELESYLTWLQMKTGNKVLAADKKGLIKKMDIKDHISIINFIYASASYKTNGEVGKDLERYQFELHQVFHGAIDYMAIKNTIEYGGVNTVFDNTLKKLLLTKPVSFFEKGYLNDFFICDQSSAFENPKNNQTLCMKEYMSTWTIDICKSLNLANLANREILRIA